MVTPCDTWIDCSDSRKTLTVEQIFKLLVIDDGNGCPALKIAGAIDAVFNPSSTQRTPTRTLNNTAGAASVAAGARSVTIETSDDFVGTILGVTAQPSRIYPFECTQNDDTVGAIAYEITSGYVIIGTLI